LPNHDAARDQKAERNRQSNLKQTKPGQDMLFGFGGRGAMLGHNSILEIRVTNAKHAGNAPKCVFMPIAN
jgi:hypothetical protein